MLYQIIGGGSNIIFSDEGFNGMVIRVDIKSADIADESEEWQEIFISAGEDWDDVVNYCVENNLTGIECLSGIPGKAGAVPMQNAGAYGQEIKDVLVSVKTVDTDFYFPRIFRNDECRFGYRTSRFKTFDRGHYVITGITLRLEKSGEPVIKHTELRNFLNFKYNYSKIHNINDKLKTVRNAVLEIRRRKSMLLNPDDPNSISCGSFFLNPVLSHKEYKTLSKRMNLEIPCHETKEGLKISAANLIEYSGFKRGFKKGGVAISEKHILSLVNRGGTTAELLHLARDIRRRVYSKTGILLEPEPEIISAFPI